MGEWKDPDGGRERGWGRQWRALVVSALLTVILTACGDDDNESGQIEWITGTPPQQSGQTIEPTATTDSEQTDPGTEPSTNDVTETSEPTAPTEPTEEPQSTATQGEAVTGRTLTADELQEFKPNELGGVPVLEYHVFVDDPKDKEQFVNTPNDLRGDLEWLYENDFYVISVQDLVTNQIKAPAGRHPVALTFDDSSAGQFRYLIDGDEVTIDPDSAVGILEAFYQEHPDFGRGGFFSVLPPENFCFAWQLTDLESDQMGYCSQKLQWLVANGYEIGNHTRDHTDLLDVSDKEFAEQLGGAIDVIQEMAPGATANIIAMPYGNYPKRGNEAQRDMLRDGFSYDGRDYIMLGALMVGSEPAYSPVSTEWDPIYVARIQAWDDETRELFPEALGDAISLDDWFSNFASAPQLLYTSDGDPNTITIPDDLPSSLDGTLDENKAGGKEVVRY